MVFYQTNPLPNWGPAARAKNVTNKSSGTSVADAIKAASAIGDSTNATGQEEGSKRKAEEEVVESREKKTKVERGDDDEEEAMNM